MPSDVRKAFGPPASVQLFWAPPTDTTAIDSNNELCEVLLRDGLKSVGILGRQPDAFFVGFPRQLHVIEEVRQFLKQ